MIVSLDIDTFYSKCYELFDVECSRNFSVYRIILIKILNQNVLTKGLFMFTIVIYKISKKNI